MERIGVTVAVRVWVSRVSMRSVLGYRVQVSVERVYIAKSRIECLG